MSNESLNELQTMIEPKDVAGSVTGRIPVEANSLRGGLSAHLDNMMGVEREVRSVASDLESLSKELEALAARLKGLMGKI